MMEIVIKMSESRVLWHTVWFLGSSNTLSSKFSYGPNRKKKTRVTRERFTLSPFFFNNDGVMLFCTQEVRVNFLDFQPKLGRKWR